jgi:hypothetical protein
MSFFSFYKKVIQGNYMRFQNIVVSIAFKRDSETAKELHKKI